MTWYSFWACFEAHAIKQERVEDAKLLGHMKRPNSGDNQVNSTQALKYQRLATNQY